MKRTLKTIYLVRHAESVWNKERRVQGTCLEVPLSPAGREQAGLLGRRLRALSFGHVYCSPAVRALETARIALGEEQSITVENDLRELGLGVWEGHLIGDINEEDRGVIDRWYRDPTNVRIEGMEEMTRFRARAVSVIGRIGEATGEADVVVVTHGGIICTYLTGILKMSLGDLWGFSLPNASITAVVFDFRPRLRSFGDTAHLDGGIPDCREAPFNTI